MKKCLVTGGCGFIGSALVKKLHKSGWQIDVVDDLSTGDLQSCMQLPARNLMTDLLPYYEEYFENDRSRETVLMINGDFASNELISRIVKGKYDYIFHVAALPRVAYSIEDPVFTTETNILKTVALLKAAAGNTKRVIFSSSSSVYGDVENFPVVEDTPRNPLSPYALQKSTCENFAVQFAQFYGLDIVCLRYFNVYGPGQMGDSPYSTVIAAWCDALKAGKALRFDGDGSQTRDFTFIEDVVDANIAAALAPSHFAGEAFNVAFGKDSSLSELLQYFQDKFGNISILESPFRPGDVLKTLADVTKTSDVLDFRAKTNLIKGLQKTWEWWEI